MMAFTYAPLPDARRHIRLFSIVPGRDGSVLKITLGGHYRLGYAERPSYAALSYAWGPPHPLHTILLNNKEISVRANLWMFLAQLRRSGEYSWLWSDAICIDQNNVAEKNAQVRIMDQVYSNAEVVIVWLGSESNGSDIIMELANKAGSESPSKSKWVDALPELPSADHDYLPAFFSLCTRPYWERTWILQELYLARGEVVILCGLKQTTLSKLQILFDRTLKNTITEGEAYPLVWGPGKQVPGFWNTLSTCTLRWLSTRRRQDETYLEDFLTKHKASLCSDPRDRVYALQNMTANRSIPVDYSMDLSELFWTVLARCQSADPRFALTLQQALRLTTLSIRECAAVGSYQNTRPILSADAFFRSAPTTPLTQLGMISTTEELRTDAISDMDSLKENVRFIVTISTDEQTIPRPYSGITKHQVQPGDVLYRLDDIPELLIILRWIKITVPMQTSLVKQEKALSELLNNRTFISFAISGDFSNLTSNQLTLLANTLFRMNLTSTRLATKGIRPIYPDDDISAWGSAGDPCLVLNRAALLAILEYFDGQKTHQA